MGVLYLLGLLVALTGMVVLDRRFRLFFWRDWRRAVVVLPVGIAIFLVWDVIGIHAGVFFRGETSFMTGVEVGRELPLEEPFFLALLCYLTMNLLAGLPMLIERSLNYRKGRADRKGGGDRSDSTGRRRRRDDRATAGRR
ncbi:lycopene cyclase domain-containing protein [Frondihabitans australicus]|uniref:Lycopene cyclase domain-containing protein n=1 Tax=Frondihabitans australicus TaxID=386892 RepID=A0A495IK44_9MICO|nr:lycopene cyclase domain-containing protein [Frondihabitans australicus]RKR76100.1 lycopene cyclase domain-containing protein [Frondihabitans australicus]